MSFMKLLTEWPLKKLALIRKITGPLAQNLADLGFIEGATVEVIRTTPFNGPIIVMVENSVYAIRSEEAKWIQVSDNP